MIVIGLHGAKQSGKDTAFGIVQEWAAERGALCVRRGFADKLKLSMARIFYPNIELQDALDLADAIKKEPPPDMGSHRDFLYTYVALGRPELNAGSMFSPEMEPADWKVMLTGRELLQRYGTESHRDVFGPNFWVDQLLPPNDYLRVIRAICNEGIYDDMPNHRLPDIVCITDLRFENEAERILALNSPSNPDWVGLTWRIVRKDQALSDAHISEKPLPSHLVTQTLDKHDGLEEYREHVLELCSAILEPQLERGRTRT